MVVAILGVVLTIFNIVDKMLQFKLKLDEPKIKQNKKIEDHERILILHEAKLNKFEEYLSHDDKRIKSILNSNKIFANALLALLSNDDAQKDKAYKQLNEFLVNNLNNDIL